jgi:hypothetical protein
MLSSKKYTLCGQKSNRKHQSQKMEIVSHEIFISRPSIHRSEILCWAQKSILYESEMHPRVMRAQKHEIQISRVKKMLFLVQNNLPLVVFIWNWKSCLHIQQTYFKKCYKFYEEKVFLGIRDTFFWSYFQKSLSTWILQYDLNTRKQLNSSEKILRVRKKLF